MCELLLEYFGAVFTLENVNNALPEVRYMFDEGSNHMLRNIELTQETIASKLSKLKANAKGLLMVYKCRWSSS
jgi:hypothetical protein